MVLIMYKYYLEDVEWRDFFIGGEEGIFGIKSTKSGIDKNKLNVEEGTIPYITRSDGDNGINLFVTDEQNEKYKMDQGNVITIGLDTQTVFYQANPFFTGQNIQVLKRDDLNENISMFIIPLIKIQMEKFNWGGNGATLSRLNGTKIMLPIDKFNNPNWFFMGEYIKERKNKQREELKDYYKNRLLDLVISPEILTDVDWGEFFLGDVFSIDTKPSKGLNHLIKADRKGIPYVGATNRNNGVLDFVEKDSKLQYEGNCIAFIRNGEGSMGYSIYKRESFIATQDISVGYNENLNEYSAKFITTIADRVRGKYTFGYKRNQARLKKEILTLPIDKDRNPNWTYMESFIKNIEQKQIKNILKYLDEYI